MTRRFRFSHLHTRFVLSTYVIEHRPWRKGLSSFTRAARIIRSLMPREQNMFGAFPRNRIARATSEEEAPVFHGNSSSEQCRDTFARPTILSTPLNQPSTSSSASRGLESPPQLDSLFSSATDSLYSGASTVSSLISNVPASASDDWCNSSNIAAMTAGPTFSWERGQGVEQGRSTRSSQPEGSRAGGHRSHPYRKEPTVRAETSCDDSELSMGPGKPTMFRGGAK